ncbi:SDR family oxidoreductase [Emticicia sp. CRIBPO]|uniref:SDR family NAD(P)-dependent oxidoreductase n=1 Tax=Emticicia sp. CRIBPO TaxID=2683258 RepID=UPI001412C22E|nr:SDR family oxidoreductase [Emticicia sp. CRIBPO]NBA88892.1 SDR family oxidoreductase [Emticicia sp. CRIBPO]
MKRFENKIAFVTGGSRGMGAAIVKRLASEGAHVVFTYSKSGEKAELLAKEVTEAGGLAKAVKADSDDAHDLTKAVNELVAEHGHIDILVNNAGIYNGKPFESHTLEEYEEIMNVNVRAVYLASHAAAPHFPAGGRVITIGSNMADNAVGPQTTLYTMSKSALQGFTRGLSRDLGAKGITVNLIQPGPVNTDMNPSDSELADFMRGRMALGEYGTTEDIAGLVSYLASEEGKFITGTAITIDGGLNA